MHKHLSTTFALTAAALFLAGCGKSQPSTTTPGGAAGSTAAGSDDATEASADEDDGVAEVKCFGINECSGQSACDVAGSHDCGGQNSCQGKGWILVSQGECERKDGKVL